MDELKDFNKFLEDNFPEYTSMVAIGSFAVGDKWIENRSDKDILLVFNCDEKEYKKYLNKINKYLKNKIFGDEYLFVPIPKEYFLKNKDHSHDFSGKFRSKILFGKNIIKHKKIPNKKQTKKIYLVGFEDVRRRTLRDLMNSAVWSKDKIRSSFWKQFKHFFMYLSIKQYYLTNKYPKTRKEVVKQFDNNGELKQILETLNNIDQKSKKDILKNGERIVRFLDDQLS